MNILITGSNGFIGKNLQEQLSIKYNISAPKRDELNLFNAEEVEAYLCEKNFDVIIHAANVNSTRDTDVSPYEILYGNLSMFYNLEKCSNHFGRMYYFGSGAEYDMRNYIPCMTEDYFAKYIPNDSYGFSKYIMAKISEQNNNIYDFVLFGVFGKYEEWSRRFISNNICNNLKGYPMTIEQNMKFDYLYIDDLTRIMEYYIENTPKYKRCNICRGEKVELLSLAKIINKVMNTNTKILIGKTGWKKEYTGNNSRFLNEIQEIHFTTFEESIKELTAFYKKQFKL